MNCRPTGCRFQTTIRYFASDTSANQWHIIVISPYHEEPVVLVKSLVHYTILRPLVTASATTELRKLLEPLKSLSHRSTFSDSRRRSAMRVHVAASLRLVSFRDTQHWISSAPHFSHRPRPKVVWESLVPLVKTLDARNLEQFRRKSRHSLNRRQQVRQNAGSRRDCSRVFKVKIQRRKPFFLFQNPCSHVAFFMRFVTVTSYKVQCWLCYHVMWGYCIGIAQPYSDSHNDW